MRGDAASMTVRRPKSVAEACKLLRREPDALPLAGGTDLMVGWNLGVLNDRTVLDLSLLHSWRRMVHRDDGTRIGALVPFTRLREDATIRRRYPLLAEAAATVGGLQIQNRATLAGNVANASPAGDSFPPLAVYDARVQVVSSEGTREVPFLEIFAGVKKTSLAPDELIARIDLPKNPRPTRGQFRKVGTRAAQAVSKVVFAGQLWARRDGTVREVRLAMGSVATTVRRLSSVEQLLQGKQLTKRRIETAVEAVQQDIAPIDDVRSTREYRMTVAQNLVRAFLA